MAAEPALQSNSSNKFESKLLSEHHRLNSRIEDLEHELRVVKSSRSWKVSAPLRLSRAIFGFVKSLFSWGEHRITLHPISNAILVGAGAWKITGSSPSFRVESSRKRMPVGFVSVSRKQSSNAPAFIILYIDAGEGFSEYYALRLRFDGQEQAECELPWLVREIRVDAPTENAVMELSDFTITERSAFLRYYRAFLVRVNEKGLATGAKSLLRRWMAAGWLPMKHLLVGHLSPWEHRRAYKKWVKLYDSPTKEVLERAKNSCTSLTSPLQFSIIMPVYNTPERWLRRALDSVLNQTYPHLQICIADDASTRPSVHSVLREYAARDSRVKVVYRAQNGHISASSNSALEIATGDFVALFDHDDELHPQALEFVAGAIEKQPNVDCVFSDEDRITDTNERCQPYFKGGFDPIHILSQNIVSHFGVYRRSLVQKIGGFREGFEGSQDWDFTLRFLQQSSPERFVHVPKVLYHWRLVAGTVSFNTDTKLDAFAAGTRAVTEYLQSRGIASDVKGAFLGGARVCPRVKPERRVAIVLYGDSPVVYTEWIEKLVSEVGVLGITTIDATGSRKDTWIKDAQQFDGDSVFFIRGDLNFKHGELVREENPFREILSLLELPEVGVVGGTVVSSTGQIVCGPLSPGDDTDIGMPFKDEVWGEPGPMGRAVSAQKCLATQLFFVGIKTEVLRSIIGKLPPQLSAFQVAKIARSLGYLVVWTPYAMCQAKENTVFSPYKTINSDDSGCELDRWGNPNIATSSNDYFMAFPPRVDDSVRVAKS